MTIIASAIPATAADATNQPWRSRIHTMPDGYRAVLYTDGTNLVVRTSASGAVWSAATVVTARSTLDALVTSLPVGNALYVFVAGTSAVTAYKLPYSGTGVWGAVVTTTPISGLTSIPQSIRAVYDAVASTIDTDHIAGAVGIIHLLLDTGPRWLLYALDPNTAGATKPKVTCQATVTNGIKNSPTYATAMILRAPNKLFIISSAGAAGWAATEVTYTSATTVTTTTTAGPSSQSWDRLTVSGGAPAWALAGGSPLTVPAGTYEYAAGSGGPIMPIADAPGGSWGHTNGTVGGYTYPAGTWVLTAHLTATGSPTGPLVSAECRVYKQASGGGLTLLGTLPFGPGEVCTTGDFALQCSAAMPAITLGPTDSLYYEVAVQTAGASMIIPASTGLYYEGAGLTTPTPTYTTSSSSSSNAYAAGAIETPALANSIYGAAVCPGDISSNPSLDIFVYNPSGPTGPTTSYMNRSSSGVYSAQLNVSGPNTQIAEAVAVSQNSVTGDQQLFMLFSQAGSRHLASIVRTGGAWAHWQQLDTSGTGLQTDFQVVGAKSLASAGPAVAYVNGNSPFNLVYEDGGFAAGATAPAPASGLALIPTSAAVPGGANDVFGTASPYACATLTPFFQAIYNEALAGDHLGAMRCVVTHPGPVTDWDSGWVSVSGGPVPGGVFDWQYGAIGSAASALVKGTTYSVVVYTQEQVGGNPSLTSAATAFIPVTLPAVNVSAPSVITSTTPTVTFDAWQAESYATTLWQLQVVDASGVIAVDNGVQAFTTPLVSTTLHAGSAIGASSLSTNGAPTVGSTIAIGTGALREIAVALTVTGTGPYTVGLDRTLANAHSTGAQVATQFTTPTISLRGKIADYTNYSVVVTVWSQVPSGPLITGTGTLAAATNIPLCPSPTAVTASWVPGTTPLTGGYVLAGWNQATGSPSPVANNVYQRVTGTATWTLVKSVVPAIGANSMRLYSVGNNAAYDIAVTAVTSEGIETPLQIATDVGGFFRVGVWLNDPASPTSCVELGLRKQNDPLIEWEPIQDKSFDPLFNRQFPVETVGTTYAYHLYQVLTWALERGYEDACMQQLRAWDQAGTVLQIRDYLGNIFYGAIMQARPTAIDHVNIRGVSIELMQIDPAGYGLLGV